MVCRTVFPAPAIQGLFILALYFLYEVVIGEICLVGVLHRYGEILWRPLQHVGGAGVVLQHAVSPLRRREIILILLERMIEDHPFVVFAQKAVLPVLDHDQLIHVILFHVTILFLTLNNPHLFATVASGCSVGAPPGRLLMHGAKIGRFLSIFVLNTRIFRSL